MIGGLLYVGIIVGAAWWIWRNNKKISVAYISKKRALSTEEMVVTVLIVRDIL